MRYDLNITLNALYSLKSVKDALLSKNEYGWRNAVIFSVHSLYMFCIANLEGTNYENVLTNDQLEDNSVYVKKGNEEKWKRSRIVWRKDSGGYNIHWDSIDGEPSFKTTPSRDFKKTEKTELISFWTALARVQDKEMHMARYIFSKALVLNEEEWKSIEKLYYYSHNFLYYTPISESFTPDYFTKDISNILRPIEFLATQSDIMLFDESAKKIVVPDLISEIKLILDVDDKTYTKG